MPGCACRGIDRLGLTNFTDVVVLADHGMTTIEADRTIYLDDYIDLSTVGSSVAVMLEVLTARHVYVPRFTWLTGLQTRL